jgi:hypothetical protein
MAECSFFKCDYDLLHIWMEQHMGQGHAYALIAHALGRLPRTIIIPICSQGMANA